MTMNDPYQQVPRDDAHAPHVDASAGALVPVSHGAAGQEERIYVGELIVTRDWVTSPQGSIPARGVRIDIVDRTQMTNAIPTWAIIVAIAGFFVLTIFSLLFLLVKEQRLSGGYEVIASGSGGTVSSFVPVTAQNASFIWNDLQFRADQARRFLDSTSA